MFNFGKFGSQDKFCSIFMLCNCSIFISATAFDKEGSMQEAVMAADISGMYGKLGINQLSISAGNHSQVRAFKSFVNQELEKK